jgi:hypothetical protein
MKVMEFDCDQCGLCCRNVGRVPGFKFLTNKNGECKYLNQETNLCMIYDKRPDFCNITKSYYKYYATEMSLEEFYQVNKAYCVKLKNGSY